MKIARYNIVFYIIVLLLQFTCLCISDFQISHKYIKIRSPLINIYLVLKCTQTYKYCNTKYNNLHNIISMRADYSNVLYL